MDKQGCGQRKSRWIEGVKEDARKWIVETGRQLHGIMSLETFASPPRVVEPAVAAAVMMMMMMMMMMMQLHYQCYHKPHS